MTESNALDVPNWYVIQTRFQKEKVANENLLRQDFAVLYPREEVYDSRHRPTYRPYFQRYLFARFPLLALSQVRSTRGVFRVVEFIRGEPLRVEDEVIALIAAQMRDDGVVMVGGDSLHIPSGYKADEAIMVTYGPLAGIAGLFRRDGDKAQRVVLLLRMLGRQFEQEFALEDTRRAFPSELAFA